MRDWHKHTFLKDIHTNSLLRPNYDEKHKTQTHIKLADQKNHTDAAVDTYHTCDARPFARPFAVIMMAAHRTSSPRSVEQPAVHTLFLSLCGESRPCDARRVSGCSHPAVFVPAVTYGITYERALCIDFVGVDARTGAFSSREHVVPMLSANEQQALGVVGGVARTAK